MRALTIEQPGQARVLESSTPDPPPGEARLRVEACGLCGTDVHIFEGAYVGDYPIVPGHEIAGVVEALGEGVTGWAVGDRVAVEPNLSCGRCTACLNNRQNFCENWQAVGVTRPGGMAESVCVPVTNLFAIDDLPAERGAFVEPLSCVLHSIERAEVRAGDRVAVLGAGPIGCLLIQAARLRGAAVIDAAERQPARRALAETCGADRVVAEVAALPIDTYDVVIDATGVVAVMQQTLDLARPGGTVLLFGVPAMDASLPIEPFKVFRKGLTIRSSFTSLRNSLQAVELLTSGRIDVAPLISHRLPFDDFEQAVAWVRAVERGVCKVILEP